MALGGNCALFGWIGESGVVRNLNVLNASIEGRISGGIVNTNYGLVENCFVSTVVNYQPATGDTNNPIGAVCSKNYGDIPQHDRGAYARRSCDGQLAV